MTDFKCSASHSDPRPPCVGRSWRRWIVRVLFLIVVWWLCAILLTQFIPPPSSVGFTGPERSSLSPQFLYDDSWLDDAGTRHVEQSIFDGLFASIDAARRFIYLDLFLFNDWQGPVPELTRALSAELTDHLVRASQREHPPRIVLVTDPINTVYGGARSHHLDALREAGVEVVMTDLVELQDSNVIWSSLWRWFVRPFGNTSEADTLANPMTDGRVSLRSWLALLNFKANHRKLAIFDNPEFGRLEAMVMSANPHDGSSAHRNLALQVHGVVVHDLLLAERQVPGLANNANALVMIDEMINFARKVTELTSSTSEHTPRIAVINESAIRRSVLDALGELDSGDAVNLEMFYLAERRIVTALTDAAERGVSVRVLLDINSDAFGRAKNGVPNRPVAAELVQHGVEVRWCATDGEQCHAKWFHARNGDMHTVVTGSGNFTRRNLADFNLESNLVFRAPSDDPTLLAMLDRFERHWYNVPGRTYSSDYEDHADSSLWLRVQYRLMEATGLGTF